MRRFLYVTLAALALCAPALTASAAPGKARIRVTIGGGTVGVIFVKSAKIAHAGCLIDCTYTYPRGTAIRIRAQPAANVTRFVRWAGACSGTRPVCSLQLTRNAHVTAVFAVGS
jgi:hypothetical protein